jgi:coenzyme F420-reducing hydrogenase delta subunit
MSDEFEPEIVVLYCRHSTNGAAETADRVRKMPGFKARLVMMPCSSKVEIGHMVKILEQGADGVQVVGCPGRLCRFLVGNTKAESRIERVRQLLGEIEFGDERVGMARKNGLSKEDLMEIAGRRADEVRTLGPNPMKKTDRP